MPWWLREPEADALAGTLDGAELGGGGVLQLGLGEEPATARGKVGPLGARLLADGVDDVGVQGMGREADEDTGLGFRHGELTGAAHRRR
jgi:hypothetical protein